MFQSAPIASKVYQFNLLIYAYNNCHNPHCSVVARYRYFIHNRRIYTHPYSSRHNNASGAAYSGTKRAIILNINNNLHL